MIKQKVNNDYIIWPLTIPPPPQKKKKKKKKNNNNNNVHTISCTDNKWNLFVKAHTC